ncbi:MAG: hypothetical protein ACE5K0_01470 [Candidatus Methanofastidiosia archaeon]
MNKRKSDLEPVRTFLNEKFANLDLSDACPNRFVKILFYNHPPIGERVEHARCWKKPDEIRNR